MSDEHSGPDPDEYSATADNNANIDDINGFGSCTPGNRCTINLDIDTDDMDAGNSFILAMSGEDEVGNTLDSGDSSKTFTLDSSYEAGDPEIDGFDVGVDDGVASVNRDVETQISVPSIDDETSDGVQVECMVDGDVVDTTDWSDSSGFECNLPIGDIGDQSVEVEARACDRVGNCRRSDVRTVVFDSSDPEVDSFDTVEDYRVFGGDFDVEFEASDRATDIGNVEYFFSSAFTEGDGFDAEVGDGSFTVDTSRLKGSSSARTVYIRVQDEAGRWSDLNGESEVDFEYFPDSQPEVNLSSDEEFRVESGGSKNLNLEVENTGRLRVDDMEVSVTSTVVNSSEVVTDLEGDSSVTLSFDISPNESHIGESVVEFSSDGPEDVESVDLIVSPNADQENEIEDRLDNYSSNLEELNSNVSELREDGLDDDLSDSIERNISGFRETVSSSRSFIEEGRYHKAYNEIESVEAEYLEARNSFSDVKEMHERDKRGKMLMLAALAVLVVFGGSGLYYLRSDRSGRDIEVPEAVKNGSVPALGLQDRLDDPGSRLGGLGRSVKKFFESDDEEGFDGFN